MGIPNRLRSGGPRTAAGKTVSSRNAVKTGVAATGWLHEGEQHEFNARLAELQAEYPNAGATIGALLERVATNIVKLNRLHRIEDALFGAARAATEQLTLQRIGNSEDGFWANSDQGRALAKELLCAAAMPDLERVDHLARYQLTLERQISKQIGEIVHLYDRRLVAVRKRHTLVLPDTVLPHGDKASPARDIVGVAGAVDVVDVVDV